MLTICTLFPSCKKRTREFPRRGHQRQRPETRVGLSLSPARPTTPPRWCGRQRLVEWTQPLRCPTALSSRGLSDCLLHIQWSRGSVLEPRKTNQADRGEPVRWTFCVVAIEHRGNLRTEFFLSLTMRRVPLSVTKTLCSYARALPASCDCVINSLPKSKANGYFPVLPIGKRASFAMKSRDGIVVFIAKQPIAPISKFMHVE